MADPKKRTLVAEQPYGMDPAFEAQVAGYCATTPEFMSSVGHALTPELMAVPAAKLIVAVAQEIYKTTGRGPKATAQILQRLRGRVESGKLKLDELADVSDTLGAFTTNTIEGGTLTMEQVRGELTPVLKKHSRRRIADAAVRDISEEGLEALRKEVSKYDKIGYSDTDSEGVNTPEKAIEALQQLRGMSRWPTGIKAIDDFMKGGPPRGTLTTFMAGAGGGKSMALSHILANCMRVNLFAAYATLEIPTGHVIARAVACRTGIPTDDVLAGDSTADRILRSHTHEFAVKDFPAKKTTMADIKEWVLKEEERAARRIDVLIVDYADLLSAGIVEEGKHGASTYQSQGIVYTELRDFLRQRDIPGFTASQSRGREERDGKKRLDIQHAADSSNKPRLVDQWITINVNDDLQEIDFFFAKNRYGEGRKSANPSPYNFAIGRVGPWVQETITVRHREPGDDSDAPATESLVIANSTDMFANTATPTTTEELPF